MTATTKTFDDVENAYLVQSDDDMVVSVQHTPEFGLLVVLQTDDGKTALAFTETAFRALSSNVPAFLDTMTMPLPGQTVH